MAEARTSGKPGKRRFIDSPAGRFLIKLAAFALLLGGFFTFVMGIHIQRGNRMYPFIMDGDVVVIWKLEKPREGDVVAYRNPETGERALSRVIAVGERTVNVTENGVLTVDGLVPAEQVFYPTAPLADSKVKWPYEMRQREVFVLDDFRTEGNDSRAFCGLHESDLLGKAVYVFRRRGI